MSDESGLAKKLGIDDFSKIDTKKANKLLDQVGKGEISEEEYITLLSLVPEFAKLSIKYLDGMIAAAKAAGASQKAALDGVTKGMDALRVLADRAQSDDTREKIGHMFVEMARILSDMNKGNNQFWGGLAVLGIGAVVLVGVVTGRISLGDAAKMVGRKVA